MIIKKPTAYDLSHWEIVTDWQGMNPRPVFLYTKATEGTGYKDPTLEIYLAGASLIGAVRGAYHFNRKEYSPTNQAAWFVKNVKPIFTAEDWAILDVEENDTPAAAMVSWFERVMSELPNNPVALYGRAEQLNKISMTSAQKAFMKTIPLIVAGYPTFPDNFETIPSYYVPDQTKYGKPIIWQYSETGIVAGIDGEVDINVVLDESILGGATVPPPDGDKMQYKVTAFINLRPSAGNTTTDLGDLYTGDIIDVDLTQNVTTGSYTGDWLRVKKITRFADGTQLFFENGVWCWGKNTELIVTPAGDVDVRVLISGETVTVTVNGENYVKG